MQAANMKHPGKLRRILLGIAVLGTSLLSASCATDPSVYAGVEPEFRIEEYFKGETRAWGIVQDRWGKVRRRFTVDMVGTWEGDEFVLKEDFVYADGETDYREWRIKPVGEHGYEGRAGDINGIAIGEAYGNALNWQYSLDVPIDDDTWTFHFNDWMYLHEDDVLVNRATFSKLGFTAGEITLFFKKP